jgi:rhamnosyltransferase
MKHSVIIPVLNPGPLLGPLVAALRAQTLAPDEIIVVDSASADGSAALARALGCRVMPIARAAFDHGGTRQMAAESAGGDILVYLTQDALPADDGALAALVRPFADPRVGACGGRQLPHKDANPLAGPRRCSTTRPSPA